VGKNVCKVSKTEMISALKKILDLTDCGRQTLKNRILLENDFFPADLGTQINAFADRYNQRYHESINNLNLANAYFGPGQAISRQRGSYIKR